MGFLPATGFAIVHPFCHGSAALLRPPHGRNESTREAQDRRLLERFLRGSYRRAWDVASGLAARGIETATRSLGNRMQSYVGNPGSPARSSSPWRGDDERNPCA